MKYESNIIEIKGLTKVHTDGVVYIGVELLDFCVFCNSVDFDIQMYSMDRGAAEVFNLDHKENDAFAGSLSLIRNAKHVSDDIWEFLGSLGNHEHESADIQEKVISEWFIRCWKKAGGEQLKMPSYFCFHDDFKALDLLELKWIMDRERWTPMKLIE